MKRSSIITTLAVLLFSAACSSPTATRLPNTAAPAVPSPTALATVSGATLVPPTAGPTLPPTAATSLPTVPATATVPPTATADPAIAGGLVGFWQGNNNSFYLFNKDGTWSWDQGAQKALTDPENKGRWWLEGDVIHMQDVSGRAPCPLADIGTYQAHLAGDSLELAAVADPCTVRIGQTSGTYTRQPAGP